MKTIHVRIDDAPDLRFDGQLIAKASDHHYEGPRNTRWTELRLWKTGSGLYVAGRCYKTCWQGERNEYAAIDARLDSSLSEFFGYSDLAKELYEKAGLDMDRHLD